MNWVIIGYAVVALITAIACLARLLREEGYAGTGTIVFVAAFGVMWPVTLTMWAWYAIEDYLWTRRNKNLCR